MMNVSGLRDDGHFTMALGRPSLDILHTTMKKIIVPCDFSTPAEETFKFAVMVVERSGGEVHVLNVIDITSMGSIPSISHSYVFNIDFLKEREEEVEQRFREMKARCAAHFSRVVF